MNIAPMQWDRVVKKSFKKKEEILPMQMREVEALKVSFGGIYVYQCIEISYDFSPFLES